MLNSYCVFGGSRVSYEKIDVNLCDISSLSIFWATQTNISHYFGWSPSLASWIKTILSRGFSAAFSSTVLGSIDVCPKLDTSRSLFMQPSDAFLTMKTPLKATKIELNLLKFRPKLPRVKAEDEVVVGHLFFIYFPPKKPFLTGSEGQDFGLKDDSLSSEHDFKWKRVFHSKETLQGPFFLSDKRKNLCSDCVFLIRTMEEPTQTHARSWKQSGPWGVW